MVVAVAVILPLLFVITMVIVAVMWFKRRRGGYTHAETSAEELGVELQDEEEEPTNDKLNVPLVNENQT